jgi:hypothetical protein
MKESNKNLLIKSTTLILFFCLSNTIICKSQVRDSVTILDFTKKKSQRIRSIDSVGFSNYVIKSPYFKKRIYNDSLQISRLETSCNTKTIFLGEYTTKDSIHFIDFVKFSNPSNHLSLGGICSSFITRDQLPQIKKITVHPSPYPSPYNFTFSECYLYIQSDTGNVVFHVKGSSLPVAAINYLLKLKENQYIYLTDIKVMTTYGKRAFSEMIYVIKN